MLAKAKELAKTQSNARAGDGASVDAQKVLSHLKAVATAPKKKVEPSKTYRGLAGGGIIVQRKGKALQVEIPMNLGVTKSKRL